MVVMRPSKNRRTESAAPAAQGPVAPRTGFSLIEATVALLILSGVTVVLLPTMKLATRENDRTRYLTHCLIEMKNVRERVLIRQRIGSSDDASTGSTELRIDGIPLSDWFRQQYPEAVLDLERAADADLTETGDGDGLKPASEESGLAAGRGIRVTITRYPDSPPDFQRKSMVLWIP